MDALRQANEVRLARAELKRRVAGGEISAGEVVGTCPWEVRTMTVLDLLKSQPRWGGIKARKILQDTDLTETKRLGGLTERQRGAVIAALQRTP